jgi:excisionase family DNA binding protein
MVGAPESLLLFLVVSRERLQRGARSTFGPARAGNSDMWSPTMPPLPRKGATCAEKAMSRICAGPRDGPLYPCRTLSPESGSRPVLTLRGAAALLELHPSTVRAQVRRGIIPGTKIGRHWRFLEADLGASRARGMEERDHGAQVRASERQAPPALCRPADFAGHSGKIGQVVGSPREAWTQFRTQQGPSKARAGRKQLG